jgi:hypothetical protein
MMKATLNVLGILAAALFASSASGAITYVDAVPNTNTTINGAAVIFPPTVGANSTITSSGTDGLWRYRVEAGTAGGNVWESDNTAAAGETTDPLITSISLGPGTYNLYGIFRDQADTASYWDASFSLDGTSFSTFDYRTATLAASDGSEFTNPADLGTIPLAGGLIYFANFGQVTLLAPTVVPIYVQGLQQDLTGASPAQANNTGQRTWYEGVGYSLVPEPSSLMLSLCGVMGLVASRRRRHFADFAR